MVRILHCFNALANGGVEAFVMSVYRHINREQVQFDFLLRDNNRTHYWDEIERMGGRIFTTPPYPRHAFKNYLATKRFMKEHFDEYDTIHVHANSLFYMTAIQLAKKYGIKNRIIHSHNTKGSNQIASIVHQYHKMSVNQFANVKLACSKAAAEWMFPDDEYTIINNGIDTEKYRFNSSVRDKIRNELHLNGKYVIGHIGRFVEQKNHRFIINLFNEYQKKDDNAVLLLVGFGPLEEQIKAQVSELGIDSKVIILNNRHDPYNLLQAMDLFLFPSVFEGFGISLLEAEASGLNCICSTAIPGEVLISDQVQVLSLDDDLERWTNEISVKKEQSHNRDVGYQQVLESGFDIQHTCDQLMKIYLG